jgi:hypothetical protein
MKKVLLVFALVAFSATVSFAQFRAGFMLDYGMPTGSGNGTDKIGLSDYAQGGFGGRAIARYAVTPQIDAGLEAGLGLFAGASEESAGLALMTNATVTGDYYFTLNKFAPYAGIGLGLYSSGSFSASGSETSGSVSGVSASTFGFTPRVGFKFGAFNFDISYVITGGAADAESGSVIIDDEEVAVTEDLKVNNSHLRFGIGFIFGSRD